LNWQRPATVGRPFSDFSARFLCAAAVIRCLGFFLTRGATEGNSMEVQNED